MSKVYTICIDAGHYGKYNQSPCNRKYYESDMVWKLHLLQKKYLEAYGFKVILTRESQDKDLALYNRGAKSKGCDLFISDHSNAVGSGVNENIDYPVVYCSINGKGDEIGKKLADCIASVMGTKQKGRIESRRGKNGDYYGVIRGATAVGTIGMILEHGFHTNTKCTNWLLDDNNLDKLAKAEADVIAEYFGVQKPVSSSTPSSITSSSNTQYRVQVGAYSEKANAEAQLKKVKEAGFDAFIAQVGNVYKIQVGAYSNKANAEAQLKKVKEAGFGSFIATYGDKVTEVEKEITTSAVKNKNVADGQAWLNVNYNNTIRTATGKILTIDGDYGSHSRNAALAVWKYMANSKYGASLTTSNTNFGNSCKKVAKKMVVKKSNTGTLTYLIQFILSAKGFYTGTMDAHFNSKLVTAVINYQKSKGLSPDGVVGANTWNALFN